MPFSLLDQFRSANGRLQVGLMPEIGRAWAVSEHRLYLWDYLASDAANVLTYDEMADPIVAVGLVAPKTAVFVEAITHVLVICTPLLIRLVGVGLGPSADGTRPITLYETERQVATEGVSMVSIASTPGGRIFLTGADGSIRELDYTLAAGWFSAKCTLKSLQSGPPAHSAVAWFGKRASGAPSFTVLLTVDAPRKLVYACTNGGNLQAFSYGDDTERSVGRLTPHGRITNVAHEASAAWARRWPQTSPPSADSFGIVALDVVSETEGASAFGLIATTLNGARLYFALPYAHSSTLRLVHVRAPPIPALSAPASGSRSVFPSLQMPTLQRVTTALSLGNSGLIAADAEGKVFLATLNAGATRSAIAQKSAQAPLDELADWMHIDATVHAIAPLPSPASSPQALLLTTQAAFVLARRTPADMLQAVLEHGGADNPEANAFVQSCGDLEGAALALAIASNVETEPAVRAQARTLFYACTSRYARLQHALALHLGRVLQPVLEKTVCPPPAPGAPTAANLASTVHEDVLASTHRALDGLKTFLDGCVDAH